MERILAEILVTIYIIFNIKIIIQYYREKDGIFQMPFMMGIVCLGVIVPQLLSLYNISYLRNISLIKLCVVLISCNWGFYYGFSKGRLHRIKQFTLIDLNIDKIKYLILIMAIIGCYFNLKNANRASIGGLEGAERASFLINNLLTSFFSYAAIFSLIKCIQKKSLKNIYFIIFISYCSLQLVTILAGARRSYVVNIASLLAFLIYNIYPSKKKIVKRCILILFLAGCFISPSISIIRTYLNSDTSLQNINYIETFKKSFTHKIDLDVGQDVYNCAKGIEYCQTNNLYSYGADLWNGFVNVYIPRFLIGEEAKKNMKIDTGYNDFIEQITHNITTMTGYFDAFAAFSFGGFIIFIGIGYFSGILFKFSNYSSLYQLTYIALLTKIHSLFSHGIQYYLNVIESMIFLLLPLIVLYISRKKLTLILKKNELRCNQ